MKFKQHLNAFFESIDFDKLFVAVSGGVDSMVLLQLLLQQKLRIHALHVNYNLRGQESNEDEKLVSEYCASNGILLSVLNVNLSEQLQNGGNLQDLARKVRYDFFEKEMKETPKAFVVLAHHEDDQIEQFWLALGRGATLSGLSGMNEKEEKRLRPLLPFRKVELIKYAIEQKIPWREDKSNQKNDYQRNVWRNELLPFLNKEIPTLSESILLIQENFKQQNEQDKEWIQQNFSNGFIGSNYLSELTENSIFQLIKLWKLPVGLVKEWPKIVQAKVGAFWQFDTIKLTKERNGLCRTEEKPISIPLLELTEVEALPTTFDKTILYLDKDKIVGEIQVRQWQLGDRIHPIGMNGSRLVSDVLKDAKIESSQKSKVFVIVDDEKIVAVHGLCIDKRSVAGKKTRKIVRVELFTI